MIVLELPMGRSSQFCRRFAARVWSDPDPDRWAPRKCNRALGNARQKKIRQENSPATEQ